MFIPPPRPLDSAAPTASEGPSTLVLFDGPADGAAEGDAEGAAPAAASISCISSSPPGWVF